MERRNQPLDILYSVVSNRALRQERRRDEGATHYLMTSSPAILVKSRYVHTQERKQKELAWSLSQTKLTQPNLTQVLTQTSKNEACTQVCMYVGISGMYTKVHTFPITHYPTVHALLKGRIRSGRKKAIITLQRETQGTTGGDYEDQDLRNRHSPRERSILNPPPIINLQLGRMSNLGH